MLSQNDFSLEEWRDLMSSPQKENGYTPIANELMEALIRYRLPGEQMQCLLLIIRKTYGYNKKTDAISLSQFELATGINRKSVCRALKGLGDKNIISIQKGSGNIATTPITKYTFNKHYNTWQGSVKKATGSGNIVTRVVAKKPHTKDNIQKTIIYTPNFLEFWTSYPKKAGKGSAFQAYQNIKEPRPTLKTIIASVESQKQSRQWQDKQFIPYPATWLKQRRWEDEVEPLDQKIIPIKPETQSDIDRELLEKLS